MKIFYFSGTGNSVVTAKKIGESLNGEVLPLTKLKDKVLKDKVIGFVLPVYCYDIPKIARKIIQDIVVPKDSYVFTIVTCGGGKGKAINRTYELLENNNRSLSYGNFVILPSNFAVMGTKLEKRQEMHDTYKVKIETIIEDIKNKKINGENFKKKPSDLIVDLSWKLGDLFLRLSDKKVDKEKCIDCELCIKICPVNNIEKVGNQYKFNNHCEDCSGCFQWCPKKAITFGGRAPKIRNAYRHPHVDVKDIIDQR